MGKSDWKSIVIIFLYIRVGGAQTTEADNEQTRLLGAHNRTRPATSNRSFFNLAPNIGQKQPLGLRQGESLSPSDISDILNKHNELRAGVTPRSSNMEHMEWDDDIAYMAQVWAQGCRFEHGQPPNVSPYTSLGQNIWAWSGTRDTPRSGIDATQDWYDEVDDYYYESNQCVYGKVCGHYTQIAWATSNKLGCGRVFCPSIGWLQNAWYIVCNYAPAGNFQDVKPYLTGAPCTQCTSGIGQCDNDLCRLCSSHDGPCDCRQKCQNCGQFSTSKCSCTCANGWWGADCSRPCTDTHEWCNRSPGWPDASFCNSYDQVPLGCPLMCGLCKAPDAGFVCDPNASGGTESICDVKFTAFVEIAGKLNIFQGKKVWRFRTDGSLRSPEAGEEANVYFKKLPGGVNSAYVRKDGKVCFVKGSNLFVYDGKTRTNKLAVSSLGLPSKIKAAFHRPGEGKKGKTYFMKGKKMWRFDEGKQTVDNGYPKRISSVFPGLGNDPSGAFRQSESRTTYVVYGKKYLKISAEGSVSNTAKKFTRLFVPGC